MMSRLLGVVVVVSVVACAQVENPIVAPGASLEKLADTFSFTEGPASDAEGNVYFTDQPNDRIHVWTLDNSLTTFLEPAGRSNGLCFDAQGALWACADARNELWRIEPSKEKTILVKEFEDKLLNGPNDIWIAPNGGAFFTDPFYKRAYWDRGPAEQSCQGVYYVAPDGAVTRVVDDLNTPNGIIGTPDGKTLYVADIGDKKTWRYQINEDGLLSDKTLFCEMGSDGMTIDTEGNVYLTGDGVPVFDPSGKQIAHIKVPEPWTANVCFGGKDRNELYITASTALYRIKTTKTGAGSQ